MLDTFILSIASFIATNIDDLIIDMFFFSAAGCTTDICRIFLGKYLGIGILIMISMAAAIGIQCIPMGYIGYLGLVPIGMGAKMLIDKNTEEDDGNYNITRRGSTAMFWNVVLVTIANGADNIGVYVPLFTGFKVSQYYIFLVVYVIMLAAWCNLGYRVARLPVFEKMINKYKIILIPVVFILLGSYIMLKSFL